MQFERTADGKMNNLPKPCIDTGMGLERIASVMQGVNDNYQNDNFIAIIDNILKTIKDRNS
jgi:alanyl-tRNA synthetase